MDALQWREWYSTSACGRRSRGLKCTVSACRPAETPTCIGSAGDERLNWRVSANATFESPGWTSSFALCGGQTQIGLYNRAGQR